MYIGKITFKGAKADNELGNRLKLTFYDGNNKFAESRVVYSKIDKSYPLIMKIAGLVLERDSFSHMLIVENKTYEPDSKNYDRYDFLITFKDKKLI